MKKKNFSCNKVLLFILLFSMPFILSSCYIHRMQNYYSEKENYITVTGTVSHMEYNNDKTKLYFSFTDLDYKFPENDFKLFGENLSVALKNGIDEKVTIGTQVTFTTAPRYFYDYYNMPIVAFSVNEESLLDFEEGYSNLQEWLKHNEI